MAAARSVHPCPPAHRRPSGSALPGKPTDGQGTAGPGSSPRRSRVETGTAGSTGAGPRRGGPRPGGQFAAGSRSSPWRSRFPPLPTLTSSAAALGPAGDRRGSLHGGGGSSPPRAQGVADRSSGGRHRGFPIPRPRPDAAKSTRWSRSSPRRGRRLVVEVVGNGRETPAPPPAPAAPPPKPPGSPPVS